MPLSPEPTADGATASLRYQMPRAETPARSTEAPRAGAVSRGAGGVNKGGRPLGSKNKPKSLVPTELADELLLKMAGSVPPEHLKYLKSVIKDGQAISTKNELDTLILLLSRNLYPALVAETSIPEAEDPDDPDEANSVALRKQLGPVFRKDVTERLKVLNSLLGLRNQVEKREDGGDDDGNKPLLKIYAARGLGGRVDVLVGVKSSGMVGDADGTGHPADDPRTVSDQLPERPLSLPSGE